MKQVVILAGGKGTRLQERLGNLPKPLIDLCGMPLLERQIRHVKHYGFNQVLVLVNYRAESIVDFCQSNDNWGLDIQCIDDGKPLGTAGSILKIYDKLEDEFLVMYGDTMLDVDLHRFYSYHSSDINSAATLFLHPNDHPHDSDLVDINDLGCITAFYPYPHDPSVFYPNLVNAALYWVRKAPLEKWRGISESNYDFGKQLFPEMLVKGLLLRGYKSPEYIKDCGTPKRIDSVCADFLSGKIGRAVLNQEQMAVFIDRDGTINREVDHLNSADQLELLPNVERAIRRLNFSEYRICVVTNQPVVARGECSREDLHNIHNKLETLLGLEGAYFDRIFYCPHHPDKGFPNEIPELKIDCNCRKPKTGLIDTAVAELNISRSRSWMIGDSTTDILTASRAGIKSILVETGYAGLDQKNWVSPDFIVPDLAAAVSFILDIYPALIKDIKPLVRDIVPGDLVFIGGQSRSGKSSFASAMRDVLQMQGMKCIIISTDFWLLNEEHRGEGVLNRHDVTALQNIIFSMGNREKRPVRLSLPGYLKTNRTQVQNVRSLETGSEDVIIFEGVVALYFAQMFNAHRCFFVTVEECVRKQRVINEYLLRGYTAEKAEAVYSERFAEEVSWIDSTNSFAVQVSIPVANNYFSSHKDSNDYQ
ncbi:MAG: HAD-IIIA family hydrolase [Desulfuromonadaceae bacterium]